MTLEGGEKSVIRGIAASVSDLRKGEVPLFYQHTGVLYALLHKSLLEAAAEHLLDYAMGVRG